MSCSAEPDDAGLCFDQYLAVLSDLERKKLMQRDTLDNLMLGLFTTMLTAIALPTQAESVWTLGVGVSLESSPIKDDAPQLLPIPIATYENDNIFGGTFTIGTTEGLSYGHSLPHGLSVSGLLDYRTSPLDDADGSVTDGIDRDLAIEVGGQIDYLTSRGIFSASVLGDVSGAHNGVEATLTYSLLIPLGAWTFQPSLGVHYRSQGLGTYLYGIEADDDQDPFRVDDHLSPFASLTASVDLSEQWSAIALVGGEYLPDAVTDSPLIDDNYTINTIFGLTFNF